MPYVGIIVICAGLFIAVYCATYAIRGRPSNRALMITNGVAGLFAAIMYSIFMYDQYIGDILSAENVRAFCMRPITVLMLGAIIANILHLRWKL